jgi:hypothetical protein
VTAEPTGEDYSPEQIRFWLSGNCSRGCRWSMLESACEGGTGATGLGSGRGNRQGLSHLKADLEHAADQLPAHWQSTALIYSKQHRSQALKQRRQTAPPLKDSQLVPEHPVPSQALENSLIRMARSLGWADVADHAA